MNTLRDFNKFNAQRYLKEYYSSVDFENEALLNFFHQVYYQLPNTNRLLEIGGGPTIYQLISASSKVNEIIFSEYTEAGRLEIKKWLDNTEDGFDWDNFFRFVLKMENKDVNSDNLEMRKDELRRKLKQLIKCDVRKSNPLYPAIYPTFDIVSINFVLESITDEKQEFANSLNSVTSLLRPGGTLIMTMIKNAKYYLFGGDCFAAFPVDEEIIYSALDKLYYKNIEVRSVATEQDRGYNGFLFVTASK